ncbi:hypothetical protein [Methanosarcina sp. 2.H.A.1B.4]|uniref:hypothetical protein n=1 Tax=Methanosarcina sp. 2.H.A.1B.4 TaxID=1483600 RepID=UPI0006227967|nr:hypothetical protein [Methanosarcina sp. 2.H.A.1B.4]KKG07491.1 hypothetical protein EO92_07400 [Methanosarcina sp. 2.H.A.1B.4]
MRYLTKILVLAACLIALSGVAAACTCGTNECKSPGYWKNHADSWSKVFCLNEKGVFIEKDWYPVDKAVDYMSEPVKGDKTYTLFKAVVAAKLNVRNGCCEDKQIESTISNASKWLYEHKVGSGVRANSEAWQGWYDQCGQWHEGGEYYYEILDAYNNGRYTCSSC